MKTYKTLSSRLLITVTCVSLSLASQISAGPGDDVREYAKQCFKKLDIDHRRLPPKMHCKAGRGASRIGLTLNGANLEKDQCPISTTSKECELEKQCDHKDWLEGSCYGNSYLTTYKIKTKTSGKEDVTMALLCRHKTINTNEIDRFDDIAMILHNKENGETCWFQTDQGPGKTNRGDAVLNPRHKNAAGFWLTPKQTRDIGCIGCHDSGPFIISPWLNQAKSAKKLRYFHNKPYKNSTPPFDKWDKPVYVSVGDRGLKPGDKSCTQCHKIATKESCSTWLDLSTTQHPITKKVFMPPSSRAMPLQPKYSKAEWEARYRDHINALSSCCNKITANPTAPDIKPHPNHPNRKVCFRE